MKGDDIMRCPRCNSENPDNQKFCGNCGFQLPPQRPTQNQPPPSYQYSGSQSNIPPKTPFYKKTWFIVLMCIFIPPAGIVFSWIAKKPKNTAARIVLTVFLALYYFVWVTMVTTDTGEYESKSKKTVEEEMEKKKNKEKEESATPIQDKESELKAETEKTEDKETDSNEPSDESTEEFEYGDCKVKYLRHEIVENDVGETVLVVYYDFTNNGEDSQCFDYLVSGKAFQNGVEVESSYWHANEESKNSEKEIQKGTTLTVADSYVLGESREKVTIEFRPFNVWSDKLLMSLELSLE